MKENVVEVKSCYDCPFLYDCFACNHPCKSVKPEVEDGDSIFDHTSEGDSTPSWCPLRETAITIRLKEVAL